MDAKECSDKMSQLNVSWFKVALLTNVATAIVCLWYGSTLAT
jgi:hypothetical protein